MTPPDATILVTTADAAPTTGVHKVSRQTGKDSAVVQVTATPSAGGTDRIRYVETAEVTVPVGETAGGIRDHLGAMCGRNNRCGMSGSRPLNSLTNVVRSFTVDDSEMTVEGTHSYEVLVRSDAGIN